jgi:MFS family permease
VRKTRLQESRRGEEYFSRDRLALSSAPVKPSVRLGFLFAVAFLASIGATLLTLGFFYFTTSVWGWDAKLNLALAASMNVFYIGGSLLAHAISERLGRRKALVVLYALMTIACLFAASFNTHLAVSICLLAYMSVTGATWPMLESLCAETPDAHAMSRRIGAYNFNWAIAGMIAVCGAGVLIEHWRGGMFIAPAILHGSGALLMLFLLIYAPSEQTFQSAHLEPEPELLQSRKLALWLSRIALPAMYVVNYALGAILPTLPIMQHFTPTQQTLCGSVWLVARTLGFAVLGFNVFWHTRPRLLLLASVGLLLAFVIVTLAPSQFVRASFAVDLTTMLCGQILLGVAMAMIYTGSLYFGMVLSQSSTEHGGYHEALIGLGGVLGPGAGALTQYIWPGDVRMAIAAVGGIVAISVIGAGGASLKLRS